MDAGFRRAVAQARQDGSLFFASVLSQERINEAFGNARWFWQGWVYSPAATVWVFLSQYLSPDHSCREAIAGLIAWRIGQGLTGCSAETRAYCTARAKIPEAACRQLACDSGHEVDRSAPASWRWLGRRTPAEVYQTKRPNRA